jgi:hypothetical protein
MKQDRKECVAFENGMNILEALKIGRGSKQQSKKNAESQKHRDKFG